MPKPKPERPSGAGVKRTDSRFLYAVPAPDRQAIICKLETGALYELPLSALECAETWDGSGLKSVEVVEDGWAVLAVLRSGAKVDFAADFVLHHCEPAYAHYRKGCAPLRVGALVRAWRERRGYTLEAVAKATGIAAPNLSRLEHDRVMPTIPTLQNLAAVLGVSVGALLHEPREPAARATRTVR